MPFIPLMRTPFTDMTGVLLTNQHHGRCQAIEMRMINCLEAYGMGKGLEQCDDLVCDFKECFLRDKQIKRIEEMEQERLRQAKVEGKPPSYLSEPRLDSFQ